MLVCISQKINCLKIPSIILIETFDPFDRLGIDEAINTYYFFTSGFFFSEVVIDMYISLFDNNNTYLLSK